MGEYKSKFTGSEIDNLLSAVNDFDTDNVIMWEGAKFMNADSAVVFNGKVSDQKHGIVLVFSYFEQNEGDDEPSAQDHSWSCHFVPKVMVELNNGGAHTFLMTINATMKTFGAKHLHISDTGITGDAANGESNDSQCGIKYSNNNYVLRYVIGV